MRSISAKFFLAFLAFIAGGCAAAIGADAPQRVVAVGDLHGDYDAYEAIISAAGLVDRRGRWKGGETIFVQTGDIPDRGPDSKKIIEHLQKLQKQAAKKGGKVVTLVGNHEAMNMTGDLRYVHPSEYEAFKDRKSNERRSIVFESNREALETFYLEQDASLSSDAIREAWYEEWPLGRVEHQLAWKADGDIGEWVASNPAVAKIGDTLFVHGGLSAEYSVFSLDDINARVAAALNSHNDSPDSILADPLGPLWYRGLVRRDSPTVQEDTINATTEAEAVAPPLRPSMEEEIDMVLSAYGAKRIVVGHTPHVEGIRASLGGRVIQIDTGASDYYGGVATYLEILGRDVIAHNVDTGERRVLSAAGEAQE